MCWRLILKEFFPELKYTKGENNIVADALYRLEILTIKISSTYLSSMDTMPRICLIFLIQFVITIFPKHRKLMLD